MTPRPLGKHQRCLLADLGGVRMAVIVGDKLSRSLVQRGLLAAEDDGSFAHITARGLRALADEIDAGRVALFDKPSAPPAGEPAA